MRLQFFKLISRKLSAFKNILKRSFLQSNTRVHGDRGIAAFRTAQNEMRTGFANNHHSRFSKFLESLSRGYYGQFGHLSEAGCARKFNRKRVAVFHHGLDHPLNCVLDISYRFSISFALSGTTRKKRTIGIIAVLLGRFDDSNEFIVASLNYLFHSRSILTPTSGYFNG
ncbi:MAG: hypothetical protein UX88_C0015G0002 [Candidatus Woesebacteria bacterium GW2011_GWC2_47_16]|nr:MAG: hypothetical protein UX34_C0012G0002 [Candidatus Woesebacteria bacterium GW2011_GWF1_46_13]KKU64234.1 MAG: hypothetical protein UX88_C0015G0002 [Candidatus Woesebacteria bacterium GW2011_GWC2_47_16]